MGLGVLVAQLTWNRVPADRKLKWSPFFQISDGSLTWSPGCSAAMVQGLAGSLTQSRSSGSEGSAGRATPTCGGSLPVDAMQYGNAMQCNRAMQQCAMRRNVSV